MKTIWRGPCHEVDTFSDSLRREHNLATPATIVEVCGDEGLMEEMYQYCKSRGIVGFDLETTGLDFFKDQIILAQIGDWDRQYLIWVQHTNVTRLLDVLRDPDIVKIGLNLKFDLTFSLYKFGLVAARACNIVDTMLTAQIIMCGIYDNVGLTLRMSSMGMQAQHWLGLKIPKALELRIGWEGWSPVEFKERIQRLTDMTMTAPQEVKNAIAQLEHKRAQKILYAADDVCIPISLAYKHRPWIKHLSLERIVRLESEFLPVLADTEVRGLPFNPDKWMELTKISEHGVIAAKQALDELFEVEITIDIDSDGNVEYSRDKNYTSPVQLLDLIRDWMMTNCGVEVIANNAHYEEALRKYAPLSEARFELLFKKGMEPDPDNPDKKKKMGYPNMKDNIEKSWDVNRHYLPPDAFLLPDTDSGTLKFLKVIYGASTSDLMADMDKVPNMVGLPPALVDPILALRGHSKNASTYGRNWLNFRSSDGRLHANFRQAALSTGRLSSTPNTMNFPADAAYRACFEARNGFKMVGADYSQVEPRVIAHLSQEPTYMKVFWSEQPGTDGYLKWCDSDTPLDLDLYTEVGKQIGQIPMHYTKLETKGNDDTEPLEDGAKGRKQAKIANLGLGYGTGKNKFHVMLCVDTGQYVRFEDVIHLFDVYWKAMGVMKKYLDASSDLASPDSERLTDHPYSKFPLAYAETIMGRKRFFLSDNPTWWTQGRNMPIQGTAGGDMLKQAAIELTHWAWKNDIEGGLVNYIHDELLAEVREDQSERFAKAMSYFMEKVGSELCPRVPIIAESYIEDFWKK